jgi:4-hydroxy-tetrahydrodipicolinate synthase
MYRPEGVHVAMLTPMKSDESLNLSVLGGEVARFKGAGIAGLFCIGTNGESYALSTAEKIVLMEALVALKPKGIDLGAGVGCTTTRATIELARRAERLGFTYISVVTPWFAAVSQEELARHCRAVAGSVSLPVVLYNIPSRTGNRLEVKTAAGLADVANIVGVKDSSGDFNAIKDLIAVGNGRFAVLCGSDNLIRDSLVAGGAGSVSGLANLVPATVAGIYRACRSGDTQLAERAQAALTRLRDALAGGNPSSATKRAANLLGHPYGPAREPTAGVPAEMEKRLPAALAECAAFEAEMARQIAAGGAR